MHVGSGEAPLKPTFPYGVQDVQGRRAHPWPCGQAPPATNCSAQERSRANAGIGAYPARPRLALHYHAAAPGPRCLHAHPTTRTMPVEASQRPNTLFTSGRRRGRSRHVRSPSQGTHNSQTTVTAKSQAHSRPKQQHPRRALRHAWIINTQPKHRLCLQQVQVHTFAHTSSVHQQPAAAAPRVGREPLKAPQGRGEPGGAGSSHLPATRFPTG